MIWKTICWARVKKVTLFRIVQEQLKNIIKHSQASKVDIYLENKEGNTQLMIKDNGIGFDTKQTHSGIGLSNIYERTRFYNGTVDIQTSPGNGCTIVVTIPASHWLVLHCSNAAGRNT